MRSGFPSLRSSGMSQNFFAFCPSAQIFPCHKSRFPLHKPNRAPASKASQTHAPARSRRSRSGSAQTARAYLGRALLLRRAIRRSHSKTPRLDAGAAFARRHDFRASGPNRQRSCRRSGVLARRLARAGAERSCPIKRVGQQPISSTMSRSTCAPTRSPPPPAADSGTPSGAGANKDTLRWSCSPRRASPLAPP